MLGGTLERGAGAAPLEIESATTTPALLIVLGGIFLAFLGVAILRPRYLLPMLLLLALMPLIPDLFRLNPGAKEPSSPAQGGQGGNQVEAASPDPALGTVLENGTLADLAASGAVSSPIISPEGGHGENDTPVFSVRGALGVSYLRVLVADTYDGRVWSRTLAPSETRVVPGGILSPPSCNGVQSRSVTIAASPVEGSAFGLWYIPTSLYPARFDDAPALSLDAEGLVVCNGAPLDHSYSCVSVINDVPLALLNEAEESDGQTGYLALPEEVPERVHKLAQDVTRGDDSTFGKAEAIREHLKTTYAYDFDYANAPPGREPTDWFLFEDRRGVCASFSSAFVVMARAVGLPTRLVAGWAIAPVADEQIVLAKQAHQWAEVSFDGLGPLRRDAAWGSPVTCAFAGR